MFPAIELRTTFEKADVVHLANLCHDCRSCFSACMYAPPHEFGVNIPLVLSQVRLDTYREHAWPRAFASALGGGLRGGLAGWVIGILAMAALVAVAGDPRQLLREQQGAGAFYRVLPYEALVLAFLALGAFVVVAMVRGLVTFWRRTASGARRPDLATLAGAAWDALSLRYLGGGDGKGCDYPGEAPSRTRRVMHSLVFWGFLAAFAATISAAVMQDLLGMLPPYPLLSPPVLLGSLGGLAMIVGAAALIAMKMRSDIRPAATRMLAWDYLFLASLELVSVTGMLTLALRDTAALGAMLLIHLASVVAFFLAMPYGKFVHWIYRSAALVHDRLDAQADAGDPGRIRP